MQRDQRFVKQCHNQMFCNCCYFQKPADEPSTIREMRYGQLFFKSHKEPKVAELRRQLNGTIAETARHISTLVSNDKAVEKTDALKKDIARIMLCKTMKIIVADGMEGEYLSDRTIAEYQSKTNPDSPEFLKEIDTLCNNSKFNTAFQNLNDHSIKAFTTEPEQATQSVFLNFAAGLSEVYDEPELPAMNHTEPVLQEIQPKEATNQSYVSLNLV